MTAFCRFARCELLAAALLGLAIVVAPLGAIEPPPKTPPAAPQLAPASNEGELAKSSFQLPPGTTIELVAAEPMVANIVTFTIDPRGRFYVAETFRQNRGVTDNRGHDQRWLDDDLAARTVADRERNFLRHLGDKAVDYLKFDDRIRVLEDRNGDGRLDWEAVFADRFNGLVEGTGAGLLVRGDSVYYTNIPHLWRLGAPGPDGRATSREPLHHGYGVRVAFRGHDLHGLILGPDGRLYFSIGDRGYHVETAEGRVLSDPESGAVFRCELDGSNLEVFATGLRNPQELAFDDHGNLFTCDNNSDSGDKARWFYLLEGAECGWRMAYQYLGDRGPYNREKIWHPHHEGQPAYVLPPIANLSDGPSGLACYPGTGFGDEYRGQFFLCDFRGTPGNSGVRRIVHAPQGAGFELKENKEFLWRVLATDVEFGPDGAMYVSDWVNGWNGEGKGRIYRVVSDEHGGSPIVAEVKRLLAEGFAQRTVKELAALLGHADRRVRLEAQFALADREEDEVLAEVAREGAPLARLHAIWGLGQIARRPLAFHAERAKDAIRPLLADSDPEVRAQAARTLGDVRDAGSYDKLVTLLTDESPRVQSLAAIALGRLSRVEAIPHLLDLLARNADSDPWLRHAAIQGLTKLHDIPTLAAHARHASPAVRLALVVALRRLMSTELTQFLHDADPRIVVEAVRAIHDRPILDAFPAIAAMADWSQRDDPLYRRVLNANYHLGTPENAAAIARAAGRSDLSESLRLEALQMLAAWEKPSGRDRVLGMWRPIEPRTVEPAREALHTVLPAILTGPQAVGAEGAKVAATLGLKEIGPTLREMAQDKSRDPATRGEALAALVQLKDDQAETMIMASLADDAPLVRAAARDALARIKPEEAAGRLEDAVFVGAAVERQRALATLATLGDKKRVEQILLRATDELLADKFPAEARLDLVLAAMALNTPPLRERLEKYNGPATDDIGRRYRDALVGGDANRGRAIFYENASASCVRCHQIGGVGGEVGPDLTKIGGAKTRQYLLDALVLPNKDIAQGFETAILELDDGRVVTGIVKRETDAELTLVTAEGATVTVKKASIEFRQPGQSAMPGDLIEKLSPLEIRDLVEYLSTRK